MLGLVVFWPSLCFLALFLRRYESAEMYWMLRDCDVPAKHLVYNKARGTQACRLGRHLGSGGSFKAALRCCRVPPSNVGHLHVEPCRRCRAATL